jgi:hypothetical protein
MSMPNRPIENCYWVVPGRLLAGEYPRTLDEETSKDRLRRLEAAGVGAFINLTEEHELSPYDGLLERASHQRFPIRDVSVPSSRELTIAILDTIDAHLARGTGVYVHCWGGVGRTGVIIGCWLARHGPGGQAALERLRHLWWKCPKSARRRSPETAAQEFYVTEWQEPKEK